MGLFLTLSESEDNMEGDSSEFDPVFRLVGDLGIFSSLLINEELNLFIFGDRIVGLLVWTLVIFSLLAGLLV